MSNYITIKLRRGTAAQWTATNPVLAEGEVGLETDTRKFKVGTGAGAWNSLQYWGGSGGGAADFVDLGDVPASYTGAGGKYVKVKSDESGLEFGTLTIAAGDLPSGIDAAKIADGTVSNTEFQTLNGASATFTSAKDSKLAGIEDNADVTDAANVNAAGAVMESDYTTAHSVLVQQSGSGSPVAVHLGNNTMLGKSGGGNIAALSASTVRSLINVEDGADVTDSANVGAVLNAATAKTTPVDADTIPLSDSAAAGALKKLSWANLKGTAKTYFDTIYAALVHTHAATDIVSGELDGDRLPAISSGKKGGVPATGTPSGKYLKDDGTWANLPGGSATWGAITGTLSSQTDLQTALDAKAELAGATFTGLIVSPAATTAGAGFRIPHGTAPTAPTNGDVWTTTTGLFMRQNGVNKQFVDFDTTQTINGVKTFSNANGTFGSSTAASTYNFASGATINGATKTVNFGTGGVAGSTTNINIGSTTGTSTTTLQGTTNGVTQAADTNNLTLATTAFVRQEINGQAVFTSTTNGLAPLSGGGTSNFLRADGTWAAPAGGGGGGADGTVLSPAQITAWQNDYNPSSWASTVGVLRINSNQFHFLSGLTATTDGHTVRIFNTGSYPIGLYNQNTDSTAANRFAFDDHDVIILPQNSVELYYDGTASRWSLAAGWTLNGESAFVSKYWNEGFTTTGDSHGATNALWPVSGGTATASATGGVTGSRVGIVDLATGTGTSGRAAFYASANSSMAYDDGTGKNYMEFRAEFRSPAVLSDATNEYFIHAGFIDSVISDSADGAFLKYTHGINSGQWQFLTADTSTRTTGNSTLALAVNTWYCLRVVMYPNGTAEFYIDGVSLGRNTANLPSNGRDFSFGIVLRKNAGTTARNMLVDGAGYTVVKYRK